MDYYQPTSIFRQNAMKRISSNPEIPRSPRKFSNESWLYQTAEATNSTILNKTMATNKINITSNYWKIPDDQLYLTAISINPENPEQLAISSGKFESNLYIYDFKQEPSMTLTHHQTISLPNIESLQWLNYDSEESTLLTGHKNGYIHMVSIPDASSDESAKILKRFNHKKHIQSMKYRSLSIKQIMKSNWYNNNQNSILSLCNENIFLWDLEHRSDLPILKNQTLGLLKFDSSPDKNGILALAGEFGIAINDLRAPVNTPSIFTPQSQAQDSFNSIGANNIKWAPYDSNILAASHLDGVVRLWDIRAQAYFGKLSGHNDLITSLEWSEESSGDLYSGGRDGNIIHWDLNFDEDLNDCCLNGGLDSINYHKEKFLVDEFDIYQVVKRRQCGNLIPAAKNPIVQMIGCGDKILSIDGSSFMGVHNKNGIDSFKSDEDIVAKMMEELIEEVQEQPIDADNDSSITFDATSSPASTLLPSPTHRHQQSITNFQNNSDHSINTLVDVGQDLKRFSLVKRKVSDSTLNSNTNEDEYAATDSFTYEKILPLNFNEDLLMNQPTIYI